MTEHMRKRDDNPTPALEKTRSPSVFHLSPGTRETLLLIFSVVGTLSLLGSALWYCRYGIDFIDESFYLVWISNPFIYSASAVPTQFGFIYHPLYELLRGDIAAFRQATILVTYLLAWVLTYTLLSTAFARHATQSGISPEKSRLKIYVLSAGFAAASLSSVVFQGMWLPTPSYNTLAFQSLLIAATGMLLADKMVSRKTLAGWVLIGIGGWLAFMAKPSTAAALAFVVMAYLIGGKKFRFRLLLVSIGAAGGLLLLSAWIIDGSITGFLIRLRTSFELLHAGESGHSIIQLISGLVNFPIHSGRSVILYFAVIMILFAAYKSQYAILKSAAIGAAVAVVMIVVIKITCGGEIGGTTVQFFLKTVFQFFLMLGVPFSIVCYLFVNRCKGFSLLSRIHWISALCFFTFPLVYSFGSNQDYWYSGSSAGFFWTFSALFMLIGGAGARFKTILPFSAATTILMAAVLLNGMVTPFRQPQPLWRNNYPVKIHGSTLILDTSNGSFIEKANYAAQSAGFKKGTPVIDLTGISPGLLYAIDAINIGQPWILGGLPGSDRLAVAALKKVSSEQIAASWLLVEPEGTMRISSEVLASFGADITRDYESVASWSTPADGFGGARFQELLRPTRSLSESIAACRNKRNQED